MQGRIREGEGLAFDIQTECGHCGRALGLEVDAAMDFKQDESGAEPLVFMPDVDWDHFEEPNIIHAY
ncbi:MAG: hypothetical protein JSW55_00485 [Chloroflexota bacterium]|nr:MAG: hypothetical protein JSW55_00485 [Chloroflexota bacterium]